MTFVVFVAIGFHILTFCALLVFERKVLRRIFGPTKENQISRIKTNEELDKLIKQKYS